MNKSKVIQPENKVTFPDRGMKHYHKLLSLVSTICVRIQVSYFFLFSMMVVVFGSPDDGNRLAMAAKNISLLDFIFHSDHKQKYKRF